MADYPDEVVAKTNKGPEIRTLVSRGRYVLCDYRNPETMEKTSNKKKLILIDESGDMQEYFIISLKQGRRNLLIEHKNKTPNQMVWNMKTKKAESI